MKDSYIINIETGIRLDVSDVECEADVDTLIGNTVQQLARKFALKEPMVMTFKHFDGGVLRSTQQLMVKPVTTYQVIPLPLGENQ